MRKGNGTTTAALLVVILILGISAFAYVSFNTQQKRQAAANLSLSVPIVQPVGSQQTTFPFALSNTGGDANQVVLTVESTAFGTVTLPPISVTGGSQVTDPITIQMKDLQNGFYTVSTTLSYQDANGTHDIRGGFSFYLLPNLQVTNFAWSPQGLAIFGKSSIGPNDNTQFSFEVQSESTTTYIHLSATANVPLTSEGLKITPGSQDIQDIGPQGTSQRYYFSISSSNTPPGKYNVTIFIMADNGNIAAQHTVVLTVTS
jgi:hypothetical protein